jgi:RNA polymerase sigma factor (sigma-70 family)
MQELDDNALLREYAESNSEEAFATLVTRHINKVYSVALRQTRNPRQAEEITQAVFVILARKSRQLGKRVILAGWLYQTARLTAVTFIRGEIRRTHREQEAYMQNILNENDSEIWTHIAPLLDAAMAELNETDRHAVVLRYFDGKSMRDVGGALGASEEAAKKRVNRAVEKLQKFFRKRGIDSTTATLTEGISAHSVLAAPAALAKSATLLAIGQGAAASGPTLTLIKGVLKAMAWAKMKFAVAVSVGALLAVGGGTAIYEVHRNLQKEDSSNAAPPPQNGPANMRIKWPLGKKYLMRMELHQGTETQLPNQPEPMKIGVDFAQNFDISAQQKLDNGGWQLELEFVKVTMAVLQGGRTIMSFDSAPGSPDADNPAAAIIGAHLKLFTDATGKIEKIEGLDELTRRIATNAKSQEQAIFKQMFSEEVVKQYTSFGEVLPNRSVNMGEDWTVRKDVATSAGAVRVDIKYTFQNWEQHADRLCAHIKTAGEISTKSISAAAGTAMEIKKGKTTGDLWFDPALGMIVEGNSDQTMSMMINTQTAALPTQLRQSVRVLLLDVH